MKIRIDRQSVKIAVLIALIYIPARLLFNTDGDVTGAFKANSVLYANAALTLLFTVILCACQKGFSKPYVKGLFGISFIYYSFALMSSIYSGIPTVTAYQAIIGIFFTIASASVGRLVVRARDSLADRFDLLMQVMLSFSLIAVATNALYLYLYFNVTNFISHGIPSDFVAVLILFYIYTTYVTKRLTPGIVLLLLSLSVTVLLLKSFSALASFAVAVVTIALYERRPVRALLLLFVSAVGFLSLYKFALEGIGEADFLGKPAEAYLTGSGRFDLYEAAINVFIHDFSPLQVTFGAGFMAERVLLVGKDLPWITDPHNSIILSGLGLGIVGLVLYAVFFAAPFFVFRNRKQGAADQKYINLWAFFHFFSIFFGLTSSYYIGRPSFLSIFSLALFYVIFVSMKKRRRLRRAENRGQPLAVVAIKDL